MKPKEIRFNPKIEIRKDPLERENIIDSVYKHFKPERQEIGDKYVKTYEILRRFQKLCKSYMSEVGIYEVYIEYGYMNCRILRYKTECNDERAVKTLYYTLGDQIIPRIERIYQGVGFESLKFNARKDMVCYQLKIGDEVKYFEIWDVPEEDK